MSDLEKALERHANYETQEWEKPILDAARRFASLTSPETIEKVWEDDKVLDWVEDYLGHLDWITAKAVMGVLLLAVLRSVEENGDKDD